MRFPIYEYLYQLNRNLHETVEILGRIEKSPGMGRKDFHMHAVVAQLVRAEATQGVLDVMNDVEVKEGGKLDRRKRAYDKRIGDPDDVYFEVMRREEERRKHGLPPLIGVVPHTVPMTEEDEEEQQELIVAEAAKKALDEHKRKTSRRRKKR